MIVPSGDLTLRAGTGLVVLDTFMGAANTKTLVLMSDYESPGDGSLTVATGKVVTSNDCDLTITAWDIDLDGSMTAGAKTLSIHGAKVAQTIGIGAVSKDMHISSSELQKMSSTGGVTIGAGNGGDVTVAGVEAAHSQHLSAIVTLAAIRDDHKVEFSGTGATFNSVSVQADNGAYFIGDVSTHIGAIYLNGDAENSSSSDALNDVNFAHGATLSSKTNVKLEATTGRITLGGDFTLRGGAGINIVSNMISSGSGYSIVLNADYESSGDGILTISASQSLTSNDGKVTITAWDIDLAGSLNSGSGTTGLLGSHVGQHIGLGATPKDMHVTSAELEQITSQGGFNLGSFTSGNIVVNGVTAAGLAPQDMTASAH
jgi:hypothetical protein